MSGHAPWREIRHKKYGNRTEAEWRVYQYRRKLWRRVLALLLLTGWVILFLKIADVISGGRLF